MPSIGLAIEYRTRRDFFIDTLFEEFDVRQSYSTKSIWAGCEVYDCYIKATNMVEKASYRKAFSFVPPTSGMFIWIAIDFESHPTFKEGEEETLEMQLWENIAEAGLLVAPGWYFAAEDEILDHGHGHFRISFSNAEVRLWFVHFAREMADLL